jgi:lipopolysaccharide export system protein LptA
MRRIDLAAWTALAALAAMGAVAAPGAARAQALDLSHGGPVTVTALGGIDWNQNDQTVTAHDDARAVRGDVTVTADRLIAHYRKKAAGPGAAAPGAAGAVAQPAARVQPAAAKPGEAAPQNPSGAPGQSGAPSDTGNNEIYRLEADGHVHIFTQTDQAWGDHAVYDIDQAVLVLTGKALKLTTPQDVLTARDAMEYWSQKHMAVGRGDATATSNDGRRITGDTLVAYTVDNSAPHPPGTPAPPPPRAAKPDKQQDPLQASGKIQRVEAYGHVQVRTLTEIVNGDRGVYVPDTGMARVVGRVHITRGENQLNGAAAIVNMKTGIATMVQTPGVRVQGLVVPNEQQPKTAPGGKPEAGGKPGAAGAPARADAPAGTRAGALPGTGPGALSGSQPGALSGSQPGALSGGQPGTLSGSQPGALSGTQPGALSGDAKKTSSETQE